MTQITINPPLAYAEDSWWLTHQGRVEEALWYDRARAEAARMQGSKAAVSLRPRCVDDLDSP